MIAWIQSLDPFVATLLATYVALVAVMFWLLWRRWRRGEGDE